MHDRHRTRIASRFDDVEIEERIHDVPPHEVWEVVVDGRRAVCKVDTGPTGTAGVEGRVTSFVDAYTSVPVPQTLAVGADFFVAAWDDEAPPPDANTRPDETWARVAGRGLATLHDETAPHLASYGRITLESTPEGLVVDGEATWHEAAVEYVRRREPTLETHGHGDVASAALDHLESHPNAFAGVGDPVCCHGWWSPEHVSVRENEVACAVDFEHAIAAPPEWDLWRAVLPVFDDDRKLAAFRQGYESVRPLPEGVDGRRPWFVLLHSVYFFESLYVQSRHDATTTARRADRLRDHVFRILDETV